MQLTPANKQQQHENSVHQGFSYFKNSYWGHDTMRNFMHYVHIHVPTYFDLWEVKVYKWRICSQKTFNCF